MPHIDLPEGLPGITSLFAYRPETAAALRGLADALLVADGPLPRGDRELIAAYVSSRNDCEFCCTSHSSFAAAQLDGGHDLVAQVKADPSTAPISPKLRALLAIAGKVQQSGLDVQADDIAAARTEGATDVEIHDTVLIAAAFCMFNRYVDGLATWSPTDDPRAFDERAQVIVEHGYSFAG
ncbi:MAG: peroxidase-related enzyme [Acidimicrobiales bacterium]